MSNTIARIGLNPLEKRAIVIGFLLAGIVIAVTTVSYVANMTFRYQWLVWVIGAAFGAVALLNLEWSRAVFGPLGEVPEARLQTFLLVSMPLAYVLASQYCGLGLQACNAVCHAVNLSGIGLTTAMAIRLRRGKSIGALLAPLVILSLVPHCLCHTPINTVWHDILGGYSPNCGAVPLAAVLFSVSALKGARPRLSAALAGMLLGVILFIVVGNPVFGFPWEGCV